MKIACDGKEILVLSDIQKMVIKNDIHSDIFESDMKRRLEYIVTHPAEHYCNMNRPSWIEIVKLNGMKEVPLNRYSLADEVLKDKPSFPDISVSVDGEEAFKILSIKRKLIREATSTKDCYSWCVDKMKFVLLHKYERCMQRLRQEWEARLAAKGFSSVPSDDDEFANLVFSQPDYKNRSERKINF